MQSADLAIGFEDVGVAWLVTEELLRGINNSSLEGVRDIVSGRSLTNLRRSMVMDADDWRRCHLFPGTVFGESCFHVAAQIDRLLWRRTGEVAIDLLATR